MEEKVLPEHTPVVQTGKDPSALPTNISPADTSGIHDDLEKGSKRQTRRPTKSPKRHHKNRNIVLVPNTTGRYVFFGIFALLMVTRLLSRHHISNRFLVVRDYGICWVVLGHFIKLGWDSFLGNDNYWKCIRFRSDHDTFSIPSPTHCIPLPVE